MQPFVRRFDGLHVLSVYGAVNAEGAALCVWSDVRMIQKFEAHHILVASWVAQSNDFVIDINILQRWLKMIVHFARHQSVNLVYQKLCQLKPVRAT